MTGFRLIKIQFVLSLLISICFIAACKKEDAKFEGEKAGQIPGLGNMSGNPEGTQFLLPSGVRLKGDVVGQEDGPSSRDCIFDGQGFFVTVKITLQRDSSSTSPVDVVFPPGLIITSASEGFQHGLLVERVVVTIPPVQPGPGGNECQVSLLLFCLNSGKSPSDATAKYKLGPISSSPLIKDFIKKLSGKKINYRDFETTDPTWFENQERLQEALWSITNGDGLTEQDKENIAALPDR